MALLAAAPTFGSILGLALAFAPPPQPPSGPLDLSPRRAAESDEEDFFDREAPAPDEKERASEAPEPSAQAEGIEDLNPAPPPPPEPTSVLESEASGAAAPSRGSAPPRPPPQGRGFWGFGGTLAGTGLVTVVSSSVLLSQSTFPQDVKFARTALGVGAGVMAAGAGLMVPGVLRWRRFNAYRRKWVLDVPPDGRGFLASSATLGVAATLDGLSLLALPPQAPSYPSLVGVAITEGSAALIALAIGIFRRVRYRRWTRERRWSTPVR